MPYDYKIINSIHCAVFSFKRVVLHAAVGRKANLHTTQVNYCRKEIDLLTCATALYIYIYIYIGQQH